MDEIICLYKHMAGNEALVYFSVPDFVVIEPQISEAAEPDGCFIGNQKHVKAAIFDLNGSLFLYDGRRLYVLESLKTRCHFYSLFGLQLFALFFEGRLCVVRIVVTKPMFIRGILDPTYDDFDATAEDFWYAAYCRWYGKFRARLPR